MRKLLILAIMGIALMACNKENPTDRIIGVMKEYTVKLENAKSIDEADKIMAEMGNEIKEIKNENPDYTPNDEEKKRIFEASAPLATAMMKFAKESIVNEIPQPVDPAPAADTSDIVNMNK